LREWKYSSYTSFFSLAASNLQREQVIEWFGNLDNFAACHHNEPGAEIDLDMDMTNNNIQHPCDTPTRS